MKDKRILALSLTAALFLSSGMGALAAGVSPSDAAKADVSQSDAVKPGGMVVREAAPSDAMVDDDDDEYYDDDDEYYDDDDDDYDEPDTSGQCGDNLTWNYADGTLTISGSGKMWDWESDEDEIPWYSFHSMIDTVKFTGNVTSIGNFAFAVSSLKSVTIPATVTSIGDSAFEYCDLTSVTIPASVTYIGKDAFYGCYQMKSINVAAANTKYTSVDGVLYNKGKTRLMCVPGGKRGAVTIPASVTGYDENALFACTKLTAINVESGNTKYASKDGVLFNKGMTRLLVYPMAKAATAYTVPSTVTEIAEGAFSYARYLERLTIPDSVKTIEPFAIRECQCLTEVIIGDGVSVIPDEMIEYCWNLKKVTLGKSVKTIDWNMIRATAPGELIISAANNNFASKDGAVYNKAMDTLLYVGNMKEYTAPASVTRIKENVLDDVHKVTILNKNCRIEDQSLWEDAVVVGYSGSTAQTLASDNYDVTFVSLSDTKRSGTWGNNMKWSLDVSTGKLVISGSGAVAIDYDEDEYEYDTPWKPYINAVKEVSFSGNITSIGDGAFSGHYLLNKVTIPNTCTSIEAAFAYCTGLKEVTIPSSVTSIGNSAFEGSGLEKVTIPNSVKRIGEYAFDSCDCLKEVVLPDSVKEVGESAFSGCQSLKQFTFSKSMTAIPEGMFGQQIWEMGESYPCYALTSITIPDRITSVGILAFANCENMKSIVIPKSVMSIGEFAFVGCEMLTDVYFTGTQAEWNKIKTIRDPDLEEELEYNGDYQTDFREDLKDVTIHYNYKPAASTLKITQQPASQSVELGKSLKLAVKAEGSGLTYQWYYKKAGATAWSKWSGHTKATETVTPNASWNGIQLYCQVKDSTGKTVNSGAAKITVTQPLKITQQPASQSVKLGNSIKLAVKAEGSGLTYQWYFKKAGAAAYSKWNGHTKATETVTPNASWNGIQLYCQVKDSSGKTVNSGAAKITVTQALKITQQPQSTTVKLGDPVKLTVKAEGTGLTYQWYFKKAGAAAYSKWNGHTKATETVTPNASWNGIQLYCQVKDSSGKTVNSSAAKITVTQSLKITQQPASQSVKLGNSVKLTVKAEGSGLTYQWYFKKKGAAAYSKWNGHTKATETVTPNASWNGIQLYCQVKDSSGKTVNSSAAKITVS